MGLLEDRQKTMKLMREGVEAQAKELEDKKKSEANKEENAQDIDIRGNNQQMTSEEVKGLFEQQASAIMQLTERLDKYEGGNE